MGQVLRLSLLLLLLLTTTIISFSTTTRTASSAVNRKSATTSSSSSSSRIPKRVGSYCVSSLLLANNANENNNNEESGSFNLSSIPRPTVTQLLSAWLVAIAGNRILESIPSVVIEGNNNNAPIPNIAFNGILFVGGLYTFIQSVMGINYEKLEDLDAKSWARQAGIFALEGRVPNEFSTAVVDDDVFPNNNKFQVATFAGGCFWGTELRFQRQVGVIATSVGYTQGHIDKPNYEQVCSGSTGHTEGIQLLYDPAQVSYDRLVVMLLDSIPDLSLVNQVGNDRGTQYRHGIYYHTEEQQMIGNQLLQSRQSQYASKPIATEIKLAQVFWPAENYHQRYLEKRGQSAEKNCEETVRCYG